VTCDPAAQRERLLARGASAEEADQRIAAQAGLAARLAPSATWILDSSGTREETRARVIEALAGVIAAGRQGGAGAPGPTRRG
jgi:dephospho-CoA kinase